MSFSRANSLGWAMFEVLTSTQMNAIDLNQSRALDGNAGGDYSTIAADIIFTGANSICWGASVYPKLASRVLQRTQPLVIAYRTVGGGGAGIDDWIYSSVAGEEGCLRHNFAYTTASEAFFILPISNLIDLAVLTRIDLLIDPPAHGTPPTRRMKGRLYRSGSGASVAIGSEIEDDVTGASYDAEHVFDLNPPYSQTVDETGHAYHLLIKGEGGTNAANGTVIKRCQAYFTTTLATPGG